MPAKRKTTTTSANDAHANLLRAAQELLAARQDQLLTALDWNDLENAVAALSPVRLTDPVEMLATLKIKKNFDRRCGGTWVTGTIAGHTFSALVFPEHAECESYELDRSRISKLWLKDHATGLEAANFDRGWDRTPTTDTAQQVVDLLSAGLAETVFGK